VARIVVAGAGAIGASVAYHLALRGAKDVVLCDRAVVASGSTGRAFGGVRQQFSTAAEASLVRESLRFFRELGPALFRAVGCLCLAVTEDELAALSARVEAQQALGVPVELVGREQIAKLAPGLETRDVLFAAFGPEDGVAEPPAVTTAIVRRAAALGVAVREWTPVERLDADVRVLCCGPWSAEVARAFGVELPVRPLVRQLVETGAVPAPESLPVVIETGTGFHFRCTHTGLRLAMTELTPRWSFDAAVDESLTPDWLRRLAARYPPAAAAGAARSWAGLYDMTPDAHPIVGQIGDGLYAACGFSGHGFMQSPAVGKALAELVVGGESSLDLEPFRLERFAAGAEFPEALVL
jgi:sarcosine oxidase subunit beta